MATTRKRAKARSENAKSDNPVVSIRLPKDVQDDAERVAKAIEEQEDWGRVTTNRVLQMAVRRGLRDLAREYKVKTRAV